MIVGVFVMQSKVTLTFRKIELKSILKNDFQSKIVVLVVGELLTESLHCIYTSSINRNKSLQWIDKCHPSLVSFGVLVNNCIII